MRRRGGAGEKKEGDEVKQDGGGNDYDVWGISDARELASRGMYDGMLDEIRALDVDGRGMDVATTTTITDDRESILYLERINRQHKEDGGGNDYDVLGISDAKESASRGVYNGMLDGIRALDVNGRGMDAAMMTTITDDRQSILYLERIKRQHKDEDGGGNDYDALGISDAKELALRGMYDGMLDEIRALDVDGRGMDVATMTTFKSSIWACKYENRLHE